MRFLLASIFLILLAANIYAKEDIVTFTVGEWVPFTSQKDTKGRIAEEIVYEAMAIEGITVKYRHVPWKRALVEAMRADSDGSFPWYITQDRQKSFYYSKEAMISTKTVFFHLKKYNYHYFFCIWFENCFPHII